MILIQNSSAMGGIIWSRAQPGPVTNYSKNIMKTDKSDSVLNKVKFNFFYSNSLIIYYFQNLIFIFFSKI